MPLVHNERIFMEQLKARYLKAKRQLFDKYYSELNQSQRDAVFTVNNPLLVLAGAGSGKTTVLVRRIVFIIKYGDAYHSDFVPYGITEDTVEKYERALQYDKEDIEPLLEEFSVEPCTPWRMLAITFTNKAANEIKHRLALAFDDEEISKEVWSGTFHSICLRILRTNAERLGYRGGFTIYDTDDTKKAISSCMKELDIDEKMLPIKSVANAIGHAKDYMITPAMFEEEAGNDYRQKLISKIYYAYQRRLLESNAMDFDDIIMNTVTILRDFSDVREFYQNKFKYVCVDEYQDTNRAQFELTALLSGGYDNIMVVGDDDQSIYKFRGATIENILDFDKSFRNAKVIKLEQNYRSTQTILDAANAIISHNENRKGKMLWTSNGSGNKITVKTLDEQNSEARYIVSEIQRKQSQGGYQFRDFAILYRTNAQSNTIERIFAKSGLPYRIIGGIRFAERKEIKDIVAYLQLINNHDDKERLLRIINEPRRKIGDKTLAGIAALAAEENCSMFDIIERADKYSALSRSAATLLEFANLINYLTEFAKNNTLSALAYELFEKSGYMQMLKAGGAEEAERIDNLQEFVSGIIDYQNSFGEDSPIFPTLTGFLEEYMLVADVDKYDESADAVVLMTIHSAKGLEFPVVFLPGMEDGLFPGIQTIMSTPEEMEEERRLAYVAVTRAKKELYITHTKCRLLYGQSQYNPPSRFIGEIPESLLDKPSIKPSVHTSERYNLNSRNSGYEYNKRLDSSILKNNNAGNIRKISSDKFAVGDVVNHISFGKGEIISTKPMGADTLYEIIFEKVGTKKLMGSYAKLTKL